jgi:hypothetical protein
MLDLNILCLSTFLKNTSHIILGTSGVVLAQTTLFSFRRKKSVNLPCISNFTELQEKNLYKLSVQALAFPCRFLLA